LVFSDEVQDVFLTDMAILSQVGLHVYSFSDTYRMTKKIGSEYIISLFVPLDQTLIFSDLILRLNKIFPALKFITKWKSEIYYMY